MFLTDSAQSLKSGKSAIMLKQVLLEAHSQTQIFVLFVEFYQWRSRNVRLDSNKMQSLTSLVQKSSICMLKAWRIIDLSRCTGSDAFTRGAAASVVSMEYIKQNKMSQVLTT